MCLHVFETDSDDRLVETWKQATREARETGSSWRSYLQATIDKAAKEAARRGISHRLVLD